MFGRKRKEGYVVESDVAVSARVDETAKLIRSSVGDFTSIMPEVLLTDSKVGKHCAIFAHGNFKELTIGDYSYISQNSFFHNGDIGRFCSIGPNLMAGWGSHPVRSLSTHPMFYAKTSPTGFSLSQDNKVEERTKINIGSDVFIGMNVTILDGVEIGHGAVVGAGAVVSKSIPPFNIVVGSPMQLIGSRFSPEVASALLEIAWWNWDGDQLKEIEKYFSDPAEFIRRHRK